MRLSQTLPRHLTLEFTSVTLVPFNRKEIFTFYSLILIVDGLLILTNTSTGQSFFHIDPTHGNYFAVFLQRQLDVSAEQNFATWYSSVLLLLAGGAALLNCKTTPLWQRLKWVQKSTWALVGGLFVWLSIDETATVHESLAPLLNQMRATSNEPYAIGAGDWIPILYPFIIAAAIGLFIFSAVAFAKRLRLMALPIVGILCWIGAIFFESSEGRPLNALDYNYIQGYQSQRLVEESLEFVGTTLFLFAFVEFYRWRSSIKETSSASAQAEKTERESSATEIAP
jgi:hypothetical protein